MPQRLERARATILFDDVGRISRRVTLDMYRSLLDGQLPSDLLQPVDDIVARRDAEIEAGKALYRYFQVEMSPFCAFPLPDFATAFPDDITAAKNQTAQSRDEMLAELDEYKELAERFPDAERSQFESSVAVSMLRAGSQIDAKQFELDAPTAEAAKRRFRIASRAVETLAMKMLAFEDAAGKRLGTALQLLQVDEVVEQIEGGDDLRDEIKSLIESARFTSQAVGQLPSLRENCRNIVELFGHLKGNEQRRKYIEVLINRLESTYEEIEALHEELEGPDYPFDHADGTISLRYYVIPDLPDPRDVGGMLYVAQAATERLITIQMKLFARLAQAAEKVEAAIGLEPLPDPAADSKKRKRQREADSVG